ncbi:right-handed parallel beta-helix repeat-containing protein [Nonomuraea sp. NPDC046802]|uniref:right-handed parallel beta-helix repeat-containing protein n=1 Tax=Nonomuraea sp. NPDC046802 TaxID=3154919 RepID=UPI0033E58286
MDLTSAQRPISRRTVVKGAGLTVAGAALSMLATARVSRAEAATPSATFYVSPAGKDSNDGSPGAPFATLEAARDAIRALKSASGLPRGGVTVYLRGGRHERSSTFSLGAQDSGTEAAPIIYRGYRGEVAEIVGSQVLDERAFAPVTDQAVLARLSPAVRDKIRQISLPAQGITDYAGAVGNPGAAVYPSAGAAAPLQLVSGDIWMTLARWPDSEYTEMDEIIDDGTSGKPLQFRYTDERPAHWASLDDVWIFGYPKYIWAYESHQIATVNAAESTITTKSGTTYGAVPGARYYYFNVLEELDSPGEWYLDRSTGKLYLYPPADLGTMSTRLTQHTTPLITMDGADHVTFADLTLGESRGTAISSTGGSDNLVLSCVFAFLGGRAVLFAGGSRNGVVGCEIHDTGIGGVVIDSGDRPTLTPGEGYVENNRIHAFARWQPNYAPAVQVHGVGNRVAHNEIHDAPHLGILFYGNDHVFEYNELHHLVYDTQDAGAVYVERDWSFQGNVLRYNYLHDINNKRSHLPRADGTQAGIYLDSAVGGTYFYGNVFERVATPIMLGSGRSNVLDNNLFLDCDQPIWMVDNSASLVSVLTERLEQMPYKREPWASRYPALVTLLDDDPMVMKYNVVIRNVSAASGPSAYSDGALEYGSFQNNWITDRADIGTLDGSHYLRGDSPVFENIDGFAVIPAALAGPYARSEQLVRLAALVKAFTDSGDIGSGLSKKLGRLLELARKALSAGRTRVAAAQLERFVSTSTACSPTAAAGLRPLAESLMATIAGDSFQKVTAHATKTVMPVGGDVRVWAMGDMLSGRYVNVFPAHTLTSLTPGLAKVGPGDTARALAVGKAGLSVSATHDGTTRTGVARVDVLTALLQKITVSAETPLLTAGGNPVTLSVTGTMTNGDPAKLAAEDLKFITSNPAVATVDAAGVVTPVAKGVTVITATATQNGISADAGLGVIVQPAQVNLPAGWSVSNFGHTVHGGDIPTQGAASYQDGVWWVASNGANIWFDRDDCTFLHQDLTGATDLTITATIRNGTAGPHPGYGLIIRDGDAESANEISWRSQQGGSLIVQYRNADKPDSWWISAPAMALPVSLRLVKQGDLFTAHLNRDGTWTAMGSVTVPMGPNLRVGLGIFAHAALAAEADIADVEISTP